MALLFDMDKDGQSLGLQISGAAVCHRSGVVTRDP